MIDQETAVINKVPDYIENGNLRSDTFVYKHNSYSLNNVPKNIKTKISSCKLCFCIGWQRIIPSEILSLFKYGIFGMHATHKKLPYGKGRSPINWGIINGAQQLFANIIQYDTGIDNGSVFSSNVIEITDRDNINSIQQRLSFIFAYESIKIIKDANRNNLNLINQNININEFFYPKRSESDGLINFNWDVVKICNFVRAQTKPYPGAFINTNVGFLKIWDCQPFPIPDLTLLHNYKNGEIVDQFSNGSIIITCSNGLLLFTNHEIPNINTNNIFIRE